MSDIPPELLEDNRPVKSKRVELFPISLLPDGTFWRCVGVFFYLAFLAFLFFVGVSSCHAATFDPNGAFCETFALDPDNGRYYIVSDPQWTPACTAWVTISAAKFQSLVDAYEGGSGTTPSTPSGSQFTTDEVTALKAQAATGLTLHLEPKPMDPEFLADLAVYTGVAMGALAVVWSARRLSDLFSISPKGD